MVVEQQPAQQPVRQAELLLARQRLDRSGVLEAAVVLGVVGDVLAATLLAGAAEHDLVL